MRQDYLSTRYLDQFISPLFASLTREIFLIQVTSAEIILSHLNVYDKKLIHMYIYHSHGPFLLCWRILGN